MIAIAWSVAIAQGLAEDPEFLVLQKGTDSVAAYSMGGELRTSTPTGPHPREMVRSRGGRYVFVTDGDNSVSILDVINRRIYAGINLGEFHNPRGIDLYPNTGQVIVSTQAPEQLLLIEPEKRTVSRHFDTKGKGAGVVTFGPGGRWAFVSNTASSNLSAIDLQNGDVTLIPTGSRPEGSVLSPSGGELYVCNRESNSITVVDTARKAAVANIPVGKGPVRIALTRDGNTLVYALMDDKKIGFADPKIRRQTDYMILPWRPVSLMLAPDGIHALVSCEESDVIYVISLSRKRIVREIHTAKGAGPSTLVPLLLAVDASIPIRRKREFRRTFP